MSIWVFRVEVNSRTAGPNPWCIEDVYVIAKTKEAAERKIKKYYHNTHGVIKSFVEKIYAL